MPARFRCSRKLPEKSFPKSIETGVVPKQFFLGFSAIAPYALFLTICLGQERENPL